MKVRILVLIILAVSLFSCERNDMLILSKMAKVDGLQLWFEDKITYDTSTSIVQKWTDNVYGTVLDSTVTAPLVVTLPGGSHALKFTASSNIQHSSWGKTISQPFTIFAAMAIDYGLASNLIFSSGGFSFYYTGSLIYFNAGSSLSWPSGGPLIQNLNYYCFIVYNSGFVDIYRNGNYETTISSIGINSINDIVFGGNTNHNFTIASFMVYNRILTAEERDIIFSYLNSYVK